MAKLKVFRRLNYYYYYFLNRLEWAIASRPFLEWECFVAVFMRYGTLPAVGGLPATVYFAVVGWAQLLGVLEKFSCPLPIPPMDGELRNYSLDWPRK